MNPPEFISDEPCPVHLIDASPVAGTPSSQWRVKGEPDPHASHYDGERAALTLGHFTDDEVANGAFMNYNAPIDVHGILAGKSHSPIAWMTAVKDRIRWLSRALERALAGNPAAALPTGDALTPITASLLRDDSGEMPAYCVMAAYRTEREALSALNALGRVQ